MLKGTSSFLIKTTSHGSGRQILQHSVLALTIVAPAPRVDILIALDRDHRTTYGSPQPQWGVILILTLRVLGVMILIGAFPFPLPNASRHGNKIMANTVAVAAVWECWWDLSLINRLLEDTFADKGDRLFRQTLPQPRRLRSGSDIPRVALRFLKLRYQHRADPVGGNTRLHWRHCCRPQIHECIPCPFHPITEYVATRVKNLGSIWNRPRTKSPRW